MAAKTPHRVCESWWHGLSREEFYKIVHEHEKHAEKDQTVYLSPSQRQSEVMPPATVPRQRHGSH